MVDTGPEQSGELSRNYVIRRALESEIVTDEPSAPRKERTVTVYDANGAPREVTFLAPILPQEEV